MAEQQRAGVRRISTEAVTLLASTIEAAKNGLRWYRENQPAADSQADDEMEHQLDRCLAMLASAADSDRYSLPPIVMTGYQLQAALGFLAPDGTAEQMQQEVCIAARNQVKDEDEGTTLPAGLFVWLEEYPEEGLMPLDNVPEISMHSLMPTLTPPDVAREGLLTCACRWRGDEQLQRCKLHESHVEVIHEWAERAKHAEQQLAKAAPARDELMAALRKAVLALPRFSFLLLHGGVSRVIDSTGRWVELDEVTKLMEPERVDVLATPPEAHDVAEKCAQIAMTVPVEFFASKLGELQLKAQRLVTAEAIRNAFPANKAHALSHASPSALAEPKNQTQWDRVYALIRHWAQRAQAAEKLVQMVIDDMGTCCGEAGADYEFKELSTETVLALRAYRQV